MIRNLFKKTPIKAWVIKQIDGEILHLCGQGALESNDRSKRVKEALEAGQYHGGVRMGDTGVVINSQRLAALVPLDRLDMVENGRIAEWQGRSWAVSQVPHRCWDYTGHLVAQKNPMSNTPALISTEDVSGISDLVNRDKAPLGDVVFRPMDALEDPLSDIEATIKEVQSRRSKATGRGWRANGTWGDLDDNPTDK